MMVGNIFKKKQQQQKIWVIFRGLIVIINIIIIGYYFLTHKNNNKFNSLWWKVGARLIIIRGKKIVDWYSVRSNKTSINDVTIDRLKVCHYHFTCWCILPCLFITNHQNGKYVWKMVVVAKSHLHHNSYHHTSILDKSECLSAKPNWSFFGLFI